MTQVLMILTKGQAQMFKNWPKIYKMGHILDAISPTDFILGTKI